MSLPSFYSNKLQITFSKIYALNAHSKRWEMINSSNTFCYSTHASWRHASKNTVHLNSISFQRSSYFFINSYTPLTAQKLEKLMMLLGSCPLWKDQNQDCIICIRDTKNQACSACNFPTIFYWRVRDHSLSSVILHNFRKYKFRKINCKRLEKRKSERITTLIHIFQFCIT